MMQRLTAYDRPFYGRADNLVLGPLNLGETAAAAGGLPGVLLRWPTGTCGSSSPSCATSTT
jgi:hypothetical protein